MDVKETKSEPPKLPEYSAHDPGADAPPAYTPPSAFAIGAKTLTNPLVQVQELKAHLALLRAFKDLRTTVEEGKAGNWPPATHILDSAQRWAWFVGLAVDRYVIWDGMCG